PDLLPGQPCCLGEVQPRLDAAFAAPNAVMTGAVVVKDALDPPAADVAVGAVRDDRGVLARDVLLIVEAVRHPAADLPGTQHSLVHLPVEGMLVVVTLGLRTQRRHEVLGFRYRHRAHICSSSPSTATSRPCCSRTRRSCASSSRIGLVLLMWM